MVALILFALVANLEKKVDCKHVFCFIIFILLSYTFIYLHALSSTSVAVGSLSFTLIKFYDSLAFAFVYFVFCK